MTSQAYVTVFKIKSFYGKGTEIMNQKVFGSQELESLKTYPLPHFKKLFLKKLQL